jgi:hypothetical protein
MKHVRDRTHYYFRIPRQCTHSDLTSTSQVFKAVISALLKYELKENTAEVICNGKFRRNLLAGSKVTGGGHMKTLHPCLSSQNTVGRLIYIYCAKLGYLIIFDHQLYNVTPLKTPFSLLIGFITIFTFT